MKRKTGLLLVAVIGFFCSVWASVGVLHAATMPAYTWLRAISTASPASVALDRDDKVYVADSVKNSVRVYSSTGAVLGEITGLGRPISVAVDANGRIYVGNDATDSVKVFGPDLSLLFSLGRGDGEVAKPASIAVDGLGSVYVVDNAVDKVKVYSPAGVLRFTFGGSGSTNGLFHSPMGVAVNEVSQEILVVDRQVITAGGGLTEGGRVQIFTMNGVYKSSFGKPSGTYLTYASNAGEMKNVGMLAKPMGLTVDSLGRVYVTDTYYNVVQVYDRTGVHLGIIANAANPLRTPVAVAVSPVSDRLYVASLSGGDVAVFGSGGGHTITATASAGGAISPAGSIGVEHGEKVSFALAADTGCHLVRVTVDGVAQDIVLPEIELIALADHVVHAEFAPDTFSFAERPSSDGDVTFSAGASVPFGAAQTVTVTPKSGYHLVDLFVDGVSVWGQLVGNSYTFANVTAAHTVEPVFAADPDVVLNILKAGNYREGDVFTYPILADGGEEVFQVTGGSSGVYNWFVFDAAGNPVWWYYATGNTFTVPVDELFANGAGVYTVEVEDRYDQELAPAFLHVRVPMRISPKFANHADTDGSVEYTVTGADGVFAWTLLTEDGQVINAPVFGTLGGSSAAVNILTLTPGLAGVTSFQVRARIADPVLAAAGLDSVIAGPQVVMPMRQIAVQVKSGATALTGAVVTAVHDQSCSAVANASGTATLPALPATGATYSFAVRKAGYLPVVVATDDLYTPLVVTLDAIASPAVISGSVAPVGPETRVMLLRGDNTGVLDSHGNQVQVLADPASGAYSLAFDTLVAGGGPYQVAARRPGYIYDLAEHEGVVAAAAGESGKDIMLHAVTRLTVLDDGASPMVTFSITADPGFNGAAGEVQAFAGASASASEVTASLVSAGGGSVYTYSIPSPAAGAAADLFVRADTSAARSAASGYFATVGYEYLLGLNAPEASLIAAPHRGGVAVTTTTSGNSAVAVPAGGVAGEIVAGATLVMTEADPQAAGIAIVSCSEIVDLALTNTATGEAFGSDAIRKVYITMKFDRGKVADGDFESGMVMICGADKIADLRAGSATVVPVNRIVKPINYGTGKVTFWADRLGAFGVGGARGGTADLVGADPAIRFIGSSRGWSDSGPDDFWIGK